LSRDGAQKENLKDDEQCKNRTNAKALNKELKKYITLTNFTYVVSMEANLFAVECSDGWLGETLSKQQVHIERELQVWA
jgi:hypothetical protein